MKKLLIIQLIILVLVAGCTNTIQSPTSEDQSIEVTIIPTTQISVITEQTILPQTIQPLQSPTVDTLCGELVYCGYVPSAIYTSIKSDRCDELYKLRLANDQKVMACLKNPYEVKGRQSLTELHCLQGIGTVEDCAKYGVKLDRDNGNVIN